MTKANPRSMQKLSTEPKFSKVTVLIARTIDLIPGDGQTGSVGVRPNLVQTPRH
jgi:hypothetical protein